MLCHITMFFLFDPHANVIFDWLSGSNFVFHRLMYQLVAMKRITQLPAEKLLQEPENSSDQEKKQIIQENCSELQPNIFWQLCKYGSLLLLDVAKSCR
jgi:hypothetical protein